MARHPMGGIARQAQTGNPAERGCLGNHTNQMVATTKVVKKIIPIGQDDEAEAPIHPADEYRDPIFQKSQGPQDQEDPRYNFKGQI